MGAREKLLSVLRGADDECFCGNPHCTSPEELVNAFAHELAEKIRKAYSQDVMDDSWVTNPYDAADLIDPEVEK